MRSRGYVHLYILSYETTRQRQKGHFNIVFFSEYKVVGPSDTQTQQENSNDHDTQQIIT